MCFTWASSLIYKDFSSFTLSCSIHNDWRSSGKVIYWVFIPKGSIVFSKVVGVYVTLWMHCITAYFEFLEICWPKVGWFFIWPLVGQIAKPLDLLVLMTNWISVDKAINYKNGDSGWLVISFEGRSTKECWLKFDIKWHMCERISAYNDKQNFCPCPSSCNQYKTVWLYWRFFKVHRWAKSWMEGVYQTLQYIQDWKNKRHEIFTAAYGNTPRAYLEMMQWKIFEKLSLKLNRNQATFVAWRQFVTVNTKKKSTSYKKCVTGEEGEC